MEKNMEHEMETGVMEVSLWTRFLQETRCFPPTAATGQKSSYSWRPEAFGRTGLFPGALISANHLIR